MDLRNKRGSGEYIVIRTKIIWSVWLRTIANPLNQIRASTGDHAFGAAKAGAWNLAQARVDTPVGAVIAQEVRDGLKK